MTGYNIVDDSLVYPHPAGCADDPCRELLFNERIDAQPFTLQLEVLVERTNIFPGSEFAPSTYAINVEVV